MLIDKNHLVLILQSDLLSFIFTTMYDPEKILVSQCKLSKSGNNYATNIL